MPPPLTRLLVPSGLAAVGESLALPEDESRHVRSRRLRDGDEVVLLDGRGARVRARLEASGTRALLLETLDAAGEPDRLVTVLLAVAEPARVEWAIEKGTESGASAFVLVDAERSQAPHLAALAARLDRLRRIASEAAKQCDRTIVPSVRGPVSLERALSLVMPTSRLVVATPGGGPVAGLPDGPLALVVGPEGGLTSGELEALRAAGAVELGLGRRVLRLETAVVVALARLVDVS